MGMSTLNDIPEGLGAMQYAQKMCEDLGLPARGNINMIGEAIEAVSKSKLFRGRPDALRVAYYWLDRRVQEARSQGQKTNNLWFLNGEYWNVEKSSAALSPNPPRYEHFGQGYGTHDMQYLFHLYRAKRKSANRALNDAEVETLMQELDKKRGEVPAWRRCE